MQFEWFMNIKYDKGKNHSSEMKNVSKFWKQYSQVLHDETGKYGHVDDK